MAVRLDCSCYLLINVYLIISELSLHILLHILCKSHRFENALTDCWSDIWAKFSSNFKYRSPSKTQVAPVFVLLLGFCFCFFVIKNMMCSFTWNLLPQGKRFYVHYYIIDRYDPPLLQFLQSSGPNVLNRQIQSRMIIYKPFSFSSREKALTFSSYKVFFPVKPACRHLCVPNVFIPNIKPININVVIM